MAHDVVSTLNAEVLEEVGELVEEDVDGPERAGLVLEVGGERPLPSWS